MTFFYILLGAHSVVVHIWLKISKKQSRSLLIYMCTVFCKH